jgi:hypothetical protein
MTGPHHAPMLIVGGFMLVPVAMAFVGGRQTGKPPAANPVREPPKQSSCDGQQKQFAIASLGLAATDRSVG